MYGTFIRPPKKTNPVGGWPEEPNRFDEIDRIFYKGADSIEYQYPRDYSNLIVRVQSTRDEKYRKEEYRAPTWQDIKILLIASNFFWRWFIGYLWHFKKKTFVLSIFIALFIWVLHYLEISVLDLISDGLHLLKSTFQS